MTTTQVSELKRKFIEQRTGVLTRRLTSLETKLFDEIFNKLISQLEVSDGKIISNNQNIDLASALDKIFKSLNQNEYLQAVKIFGSDLLQLQDLNKTYFNIIEKDQAKIEKITKDVNSIMRKRIGLNSKGAFEKSGYLDRLVNDTALATKLKNTAYKAISSGEGITTFTEKIKLITVGNDNVNGGLVKHFEQYAFDTYAQFNRTTAKLYAERLDLRAFVYQGGEIQTSRCFCIERDGKVFTTDEAEKWKSKLNKKCGPIMAKDATYDPLTDLGGINCRHSTDYISNEMAKRLRPDLDGILD